MLERIADGEAVQIANIVQLTLRQLAQRYGNHKRVLRGVHAKGHGCVAATFTIEVDLPERLRRGVFAEPGKTHNAVIRFSNADVLVRADSTVGESGVPPAHGSRGMALKLLGVNGANLTCGCGVQDFLMINQPVFAFANVEDYEVLSRVLADDADDPTKFFAERLPKKDGGPPTASQLRALETAGIVQRIRAASTAANPAAFQVPPASPLDNDYFGAAPFLFGPDQVMRFRVRPASRSASEPDVADPDYLRAALAERLRDPGADSIVFSFEAQVRSADDIVPDRDIENASHGWGDDVPFERLALVRIPPQEVESDELLERCERTEFSPWHALEDHRPLGGINRLRRAVYDASAAARREVVAKS